MIIPREEWGSENRLVIDDQGKLWRIIGFISDPAVILDPVIEKGAEAPWIEERQRMTIVMGSNQSKDFRRLIPEER